MLVKPMNTHDLLIQLEALLVSHQDKQRRAESAERDGSGPALASPQGAGHAIPAQPKRATGE
jgi:hypothetical protein